MEKLSSLTFYQVLKLPNKILFFSLKIERTHLVNIFFHGLNKQFVAFGKYMQGMISLTLSAVLPQLRPAPCKGDQQVCQEADAGQEAILYISLLLGALGSGGIRPCVVAFGADQFDERDPKQNTKTWTYFNWYYFVMGASILVAVTVLVYIQDNVGWGWGLGVPTIAMLISIVTFIIGYPLYRNLDPVGSPFTRLIQVIVAAYKKRKLPMVSDPKLLYQNDELDASISLGGKLLHTKHMK